MSTSSARREKSTPPTPRNPPAGDEGAVEHGPGDRHDADAGEEHHGAGSFSASVRGRRLRLSLALTLLISGGRFLFGYLEQERQSRVYEEAEQTLSGIALVQACSAEAEQDRQDLEAIVRSSGLPDLAWSVEVLHTIARTLHHCHKAGVVHRDVKPANVLIERDLVDDLELVAGVDRRVELLRVVRQQADLRETQVLQHLDTHAIVAAVGVVPQGQVGFDGVQPLILQGVSLDFIDQPDSAALLTDI